MVGVFLDLKKAFDTVNHSILLQKLYVYGVRGNMHACFKSYLSNRVQYTKIENTMSEKREITLSKIHIMKLSLTI